MSSDTANLLREHVLATAKLLTNEKPNKEENTDAEPTVRNGGGSPAARPPQQRESGR